MKSRLIASLGLALAIAGGVTGCTLLTPQATTLHYNASDGISLNIGDLSLRNILVISDDGKNGNLVMTVVNTSNNNAQLAITFGSGSGSRIDSPIVVKSHSTLVLDASHAETTAPKQNASETLAAPITLTGIYTKPGSLLPVFFSTGSAEGSQIQVPVLDGRLPEYAHLLPVATPTP